MKLSGSPNALGAKRAREVRAVTRAINPKRSLYEK